MHNLRSIVVHLDNTARSEVRLRIAMALARAAPAHLAALYAVTSLATVQPIAVAGGGVVFSPALDDLEREQCEQARARFDRVVAGAEPPVAWEDAARVPTYTALAARALTADLVVFGQHDAAEPLTAAEAGLVASTLIDSGTPGLVIPHSGSFAPDALTRPGLCVVLGWKPSREAARAARAALPWLLQAREVHIAVASATEVSEPWPGAPQLRAWLLRHGVKAALREHSIGHANAGEMLLSMAADVSADLLAMGCFGHSRARELVLGGASRTVLRSMTLPTLLAH